MGEISKFKLFMPLDIQRFAATMSVSLNENSWDIGSNTSNVTVTITVRRTSGTTWWSNAKTGTVTIDGVNYSFSLALQSSQTSSSTTVNATIGHNSDGSKSVYVSAYLYVGTSVGSFSADGTFGLTTIPRYANITSFSVSNISGFDGLTKLKITYSADANLDYAWYSTNGGSSWATLPTSNIISGLSPGTTYNVKIRVRRSDSQLTTDSGSISKTTHQINQVTSGTPNVSNGSSLDVTANNPSGATCRIKLECANVERYIKSGTNATFSVEEITSLMQYYTTSKSFTIRVIACTLNDNGEEKYWHYIDGTYTIINSNPTFENFIYFDNDSNIVEITGNNIYIVKNKSKLKISIPSTKKMEAKNYATPLLYRIDVGELTGNIAYSTNDVSLELGVLNIAGAINLSVSAIDSRGFISTKTKTIYVIDYEPPTQSVSIKRVNEFEDTTKINVGGVFSLITCGTTDKNAIQSVRYRYKESTSSTWGAWQSLTISKNGNNYTCIQKAITLDNEKSFNFEIEVKDKIETITLPYFVAQGIPIEFINASKKNVGIGVINDKEEYSLAMRGNIYLKSGNAVLDYEVIAEWE